MGLAGPVSAAELDAVEAHLCPEGAGPRQLELCPFVDPSLPGLLAERGYRVHEWQLVWTRPVPRDPLAPPPPGITVSRVRPGEEERYFRAVLAGFLETEQVPEEALV